MTSLAQLKRDLRKHASKEKALLLSRFFKTGKGQYGEGDVFIGVTVPNTRSVATAHRDLSLTDVKELLASPVHEERLCALLLLVHNFERGDVKTRTAIYRLYLSHTKYINNWDLVDLSAPNIVGRYLVDHAGWRPVLTKLARSRNLWERRIAILATLAFTYNGNATPALTIAKLLLHDDHDLIHKAVGWMLREVGKRVSQPELERFLGRYARTMPRTMLRYAIERFPKALRQRYLSGSI